MHSIVYRSIRSGLYTLCRARRTTSPSDTPTAHSLSLHVAPSSHLIVVCDAESIAEPTSAEKVKGKLTDSIFNEMLEFFQNVFPTAKGYKLPPSYYAIKKTFKMIGLGYESIHACVNDCFLFRGDANKDVHFCPVCNTSIWKDGNTPGKKVPKKVLRYFLIILRLQRLYKSSHTAKEMTWHATGKCTKPGKMQHPVDSSAWKDFDTKYPDFAAEPRNVRLWLAADGFNPFGNLSQSYSMWPVILTTYNLPPWLCMKQSSFMLTLLIPGPKSPGKDIDVYLRPLIDDLKDLWAKPGVETIYVATGLKFNIRAMVLWTINDFTARSSLSRWSGQGYKACPTYNEDTPYVRVLGKTAYVGHIIFLKKTHKWRRSLKFNGETENGDPPKEFSQDAIMTQLARLPTRVKDVMHIEKNVLESILNTLLMNDKSKYTAKARQDLKRLGIRSGLWLGQNKNGKCSKPQAAYSFKPEDRKKFCQFIKGVKLPDGFRSNFKHKVTDNDTNITGLKSHDCHIMMQRLLPYGLQQYLPPDVAKPLIELCLFFKQICSQTLMVDDMLKAQSKMSADVARGHGGDGGGDDRPPSHHIPTGCGGCLGNRGKGTRKPNLGGRRAGRQHTRQETRNLGLKAITDKSGPVSIRFEFGDRETLMPLGEHAAHWANYLGELVRELPLHYPSWRQVPAEQKAGVMARIGTQFDMRPHMESDRWPLIYAAIQQHLQKIYNGKKAALKERHWIPDSDGTYDLERIRLSRPSHISEVNWDAQIAFWNDPKNRARATQNKQNRAKSKVVCRQGSRSIAALRDMHMESSVTKEYPSLIHTFFLTHTINGVFLNHEEKALYEEMLRLQGLGSNTDTGVPYTEDEIMAIVRGGKQRGHIPGVGRVLPGQDTVIPPLSPCTHSSDVIKLKKIEKVLTRQVDMFMKLFRSDDKFSQMLNQLESQPEIGGGNGSGGCGDDEQGDDEDDGEDGEDEDDS
ncbi:hypothetical protein Tco_0978422 [Tanacetum coccineum]|uniref:Transposase n=1 Tax=Tanacetum coccineum TaxID=301880 RepID=A0ABQ5EN14_9ASTR